jgi:arylsulfatase A-like enzyme
LYDESIHVPLIYYLPGLNKGMRIEPLVQSIDTLPTLLGLLSIPVPAQAQGVSLVGLLEDKRHAPVNEFVFSQGLNGIFSLRSEKWKYIRKRQDLSGGPRKVSEYIFDLRKDKSEKNDLIRSCPKIAKMLSDRLDSWKEHLTIYNNEKREFSPDVTEEMREQIRKTGYW